MILRSRQFLLRALTDTDQENVFHGLSHPDVIRYYAISFPTLEATRVQMEWYAQLEREGTGQWWAICSPDGGSFMGAVGIYGIVQKHRKADLGYWLLPEHWGKGVMSEALALVLEHGFKNMGLHRIEAEVETENEASRHLLLKLGFHHEGTKRECEFKDGRWISLDLFARLEPVR